MVLGLVVALAAVGLAAKPAFKFAKAKRYPVGGSPLGIASGDFNRDGRLDLAVSDFAGEQGETRAITILKGLRRGRFKPVKTFPTMLQPDGIEAARIGPGRDLDLVVGGFVSAGKISVFPGGPGLSFGAPQEYPAGGSQAAPRWVATGDFNSDGRTDVAASDQHTGEIDVLIGSAGGGFAPPANYPADGEYGRLISTRINRDKRPDLAFSGFGDRAVLVFIARRNGTFKPFTKRKVGAVPSAVAAGDLNHDGKTDLVVSAVKPPTLAAPVRPVAARGGDPTAAAQVRVLLGRGNGSFRRPKGYRIGPVGMPSGLTVGRFNGDKRPDVAVTLPYRDQVAILPGTKRGRLGRPFNALVGDGPYAVIGGRFDRGRSRDIATVDPQGDAISVLLNKRR